MDRTEQRRIVEALVMSTPEPISAARLAEIVPGCSPGDAKDLINELNTEYQEQDRSFEIWEVAGGYQVRTRAEFSGYMQQLHKQRPLRLSRAALDTLSIIAYKQPVTRGEIEEVRGVEAGPVVKGLLDRRLVRIAGQREVPGRPMLYATTRRFLEVFGLESLKDLPSLRELKDLADQKGVALSETDGEGAADSETPAAGEEQLSLDAVDTVVGGDIDGDVGSDVVEDVGAADGEGDGEGEPTISAELSDAGAEESLVESSEDSQGERLGESPADLQDVRAEEALGADAEAPDAEDDEVR